MPRNTTETTVKNKILIVEDDKALLKYLVKYIKKRGYSIVEAENGLKAWDLFLQEKPSLIVSDIYMPELNGLELLKRVMSLSPEIPVVLLSGAGTMNDVISAMRLGAWDYIGKPIEDPDILVYTINKALEWVKLKKLSNEYQERLEAKVLEKTGELLAELKTREVAEKNLEQAKREWEETFDALPDLIAIVNADKKIIRANRAMAAALDAKPVDLVGEEFSLFSGHNWSPVTIEAATESALSQHRPEIFDKKLQRHFELSVVPYSDPSTGAQIGSIHIARDIDQRKRAEAEKEKIQFQLLQAQKLESVGQLAAGIAHEINTPVQYVATNVDFLDQAFSDLQHVINQCETLLERAEGNTLSKETIEKTRRMLDDADWEYLKKEIPSSIEQSRNGLNRVTTIVRAMKEFSHPGSKEKEPVDLAHIIETTVIVARNEWKYVAEVVTDYDKDLPRVLCLAEEISQVILNLLINAAHAIGDKLGENPEGQKGTITITTKAVPGFAEITVGDTGTGIPEKIRGRIFDPFFTTKKVGRGTGQGLAIVNNVITGKHHGSIALESIPGQGTTFRLRIPVSEKNKAILEA